jgi:hypothetical protein
MRRKKYRKPMMHHCRMWRTDGIAGLTWEQVMSTDMMVRMVKLRMQIRRKIPRKSMIHQRRSPKIEGIILESVKIRQYISDQ